MRNPTPYASLLNDAPPADVDGADADLDLCPDGGLCWPDDPLDSVIGYMSMLDDGFLEGLGLGSSPPPGPVGDGQDYSKAALEGMKADADLGSLAEERPLSLRDAGAPGCRKRSASYVFDSKPEGLPPARARSLSCSTTITSSSTASGSRSLSPTSGGTESPREPASGDDDLRWTLPRKPHHRRTVRRRAPSWSFALPPPLMSAAAAYRCHGDSNANDDKDKDYVLSRCKKGRGNGGPRRARRQQKKTEDKICTHCHAAETPQWRAGPAGSSTLCNACGIRYKMGKLFPEYRPSTSPHFSSLEHSNRHRNVERIRDRKKKLKVMSPELPVSPDADDKLLLESVNMKCS